jgi:hypothetical protein
VIGNQEEGIMVQISSENGKAEILKYEGDDSTTLEFGSQKIGKISAARFENFAYAYFSDVMIGCKVDQSGFSFEIGRRDNQNGSQPSEFFGKSTTSDVTCFGRNLSLSRCSSHDLTSTNQNASVRISRKTNQTVHLNQFASSLRQM